MPRGVDSLFEGHVGRVEQNGVFGGAKGESARLRSRWSRARRSAMTSSGCTTGLLSLPPS